MEQGMGSSESACRGFNWSAAQIDRKGQEKMKKSKICLGCLRMIDSSEKSCPFCGFDPDAVTDKKLLPAGILLYHRYYVGKVLGEGGFGITYTGYDISEKRPVAIKEYFPANIAQRNISQENSNAVIPFDGDNGNIYARGLERFAQEAKVLKKLTKLSHVVKVYDYFLQNNTGYLIMEYVPGMTLRKVVQEKGCFSYQEMFPIIKPIMEDLSVIHDMGMIHRDISPDNIILQANGIAKVIDFGTTRTVVQKDDGTNRTMTVMLRQQYAPKEQYLPNGNVGAWSDIYSLCATIYFMLLGTDPKNVFERDAKDMEKAFRGAEIPYDAGFVRILEKGMQVEASKRYASVRELQKEMEKAVLGEEKDTDAQEHTIYIDQEQRKRKRISLRKKKRCLLLAVCGLCFVGAVSFGWQRYRSYKNNVAKSSVQNVVQNEEASKQRISVEKTATPEPSPEVTADVTEENPLVIIPDVKNRSKKEACRLLHTVDPDLIIVVEKQYNTKVKKGRVIAQSIAGGKSFRKKKEQEIVLTVSRGRKQEANVRKTTTPIATPAATKQPQVKVAPKKTKAPQKNIKIITQD